METKSIIDRVNQIRDDLKQLAESIKELPTNPNIEHLGNNCFSLKSSELFKYGKWSPEFYNFEYQYNFIAEVVNTLPIDQVVDKLNRIIETERYYHKGNLFTFHPDVIQNLKSIIK